MSAAAEKVKHYGFALATVYMCYFTYGIQALILSQNKVNFYTQWGITDPTAGSAAVSMAIAAMGFGKLLSVWIGGELSDRVGRKKFAVAGAGCLHHLLHYDAAGNRCNRLLHRRLPVRRCNIWLLGMRPCTPPHKKRAEIRRIRRYRHQGRRFRYGRYLPHLRCSIQRTSYLAR